MHKIACRIAKVISLFFFINEILIFEKLHRSAERGAETLRSVHAANVCEWEITKKEKVKFSI